MRGLLAISSHCAVGVNAITRVPGLGPTSCCGTSSPTQDFLNIVRDRSLAGRVPMCPSSRSCQCYAPHDTPLSTARLRRLCWQAWHYLRVIAKGQGAAVACGHPRMLLYTGCTRPSVKPFALALARTSVVAQSTPSRRRTSVQGATGPWMVEAINCLDPGRMQCGTVPCLQVANRLFSSLESTPPCLHLNTVCMFLCSPTLQPVAVS